ncbi:MAG: 4Fe-4S double cluster binding domain-containing protein [Spirochaetales bacterium]|nr:4Fe-4S double cluster binding domain-containing protein [Spirochaetales bacterium]
MTDGTSLKNLILRLAREENFPRSRMLNPLPLADRSAHTDQPYPEGARSALLVFLPYDLKEGPGVLAPFARSNYYREAMARLKRIASAVRRETGCSKGDLRLFCNSRFPEKQMAWHCGLGTLGKNSLLITPEYGSLGIVAGMFLPFDLPGDSPLESAPYEGCGSCSLCRRACPAGALRKEGGLERKLCFQHLSTEPVILSAEQTARWDLLYGCQICQDVCPRNRDRAAGQPLGRGYLGPEPDLEFLLTSSPEELKAAFKGSVLGQSWIDPILLQRNALICLWNRSDRETAKKLAQRCADDPRKILAETARCLLSLIPDKV